MWACREIANFRWRFFESTVLGATWIRYGKQNRIRGPFWLSFKHVKTFHLEWIEDFHGRFRWLWLEWYHPNGWKTAILTFLLPLFDRIVVLLLTCPPGLPGYNFAWSLIKSSVVKGWWFRQIFLVGKPCLVWRRKRSNVALLQEISLLSCPQVAPCTSSGLEGNQFRWEWTPLFSLWTLSVSFSECEPTCQQFKPILAQHCLKNPWYDILTEKRKGTKPPDTRHCNQSTAGSWKSLVTCNVWVFFWHKCVTIPEIPGICNIWR